MNDKPIVTNPLKKRDTDILFEGLNDEESIEFQVNNWANGKPLHNPIRDECCPDFSCCSGGEMMSLETRKRFAEAYRNGDEAGQLSIMGMGLSIAFSNSNIYIAGEDPETH